MLLLRAPGIRFTRADLRLIINIDKHNDITH